MVSLSLLSHILIAVCMDRMKMYSYARCVRWRSGYLLCLFKKEVGKHSTQSPANNRKCNPDCRHGTWTVPCL